MSTHSRVAFLATGSALALAAGSPARAQTSPAPLRVGIGPFDAYGEAWYGVDAGIFQKDGLTVDVNVLNSGNTAASAVVAGSLDIVGTTTLLIANAVASGIPFVIIAEGTINTPQATQAMLCVRKDSSIHTAKDLIGKTVGMNVLRSVPELGLDMWLAKSGIEPSQVRVVEVLAAEMGPSLERGAIDAFIIGEPALSAALRTNNVRPVIDALSGISPRFMFSGWFATASFVRANPDLVRRFANSIYDVARWANQHHAETAPILAKYTKLDVADVTTMKRAEFAERMNIGELQPLLDAGAKFKFLLRQMAATEFLPKT